MPVPQSDRFRENWDRAKPDHALFTAALTQHVNAQGLVNYAAMSMDHYYLEYVHRLASVEVARLPDSAAKLAFWINAYNALAIQGALETMPKDVMKWHEHNVLNVKVAGFEQPGKGFFEGLRFVVGGRRLSLGEIEKAILLKKPDWVKKDPAYYSSVSPDVVDPRVHFALVCASIGCVRLLPEAYEPSRIEVQLEAAARRFARDPARARFDIPARTLHASRLLEWYAEDFTNPAHTPHAANVPAFFAKYVEDESLARSLMAEPWTVAYAEYDWSLNIQR